MCYIKCAHLNITDIVIKNIQQPEDKPPSEAKLYQTVSLQAPTLILLNTNSTIPKVTPARELLQKLTE